MSIQLEEQHLELEERKINGEKFCQERERLGLSQEKFGLLVGLQQAGVNALEKEYRSPAKVLRSTSVEKFIRSAEVFQCSLDYLADLTDERRSVKQILAELKDIKSRGIMIMPDSDEQGETLKALLEDAKKLSKDDLLMISALAKKLS